eukprot:761214-Prymnesium_polylepis.1
MDDLVQNRGFDAMTAMVQNGEGGLMRTTVQSEIDTQVALLELDQQVLAPGDAQGDSQSFSIEELTRLLDDDLRDVPILGIKGTTKTGKCRGGKPYALRSEKAW